MTLEPFQTPTPEIEPDWEDVEKVICPICGSDQITYDGEIYDDDEHLGSYFNCTECHHGFGEHDADDALF